MAICKKCGHSIPDDAVACPNCGKPVKGKRKKNKKKKNNGGTIALVIIFIVFILGIAGSIVFLLIRETEPQLSTFGVNCAEFSDALNRVLEAEHSDKYITSSKWSANDAHTAFDYDGGSFVMHAKTAKNNDVSSKIRELRIGPTNTEDGVTMAALSAVALETGLNKDTVLRNMAEVKAMTRDKISYEAVSFTFDRTKDEYVLVPGNGTKSDDYHATSDQAALPEFNTTAFVAGNGFVSAGEKYVFSGGSGIRFRDKITDNNTVITKAANDGQLLTDGNVVYYIKKVQKERQVFSVGLDGSGEQMLLSLPEDVTLIHVRNNTLYYALADAQTPDVCTLWKYRLDTMENTKLEEVSFAPQRTLVCGELLYCSLSDDPDADLQLSAAYAFNFDTEEFSEAIPHCQVAQHGYIIPHRQHRLALHRSLSLYRGGRQAPKITRDQGGRAAVARLSEVRRRHSLRQPYSQILPLQPQDRQDGRADRAGSRQLYLRHRQARGYLFLHCGRCIAEPCAERYLQARIGRADPILCARRNGFARRPSGHCKRLYPRFEF